METKDGYCAVLKDDGTVEKVKLAAQVGDEIDMAVVEKKERKIRRFPLRYVATAASVALVAVSSGYLSFMQDYSFVSMDVDASVEYSLNRMDRVVHVNAFNESGETLAQSVMQEGVEGNTLDEAVNKTADVLQRDGYMDASDDVVLVSVTSKSDKKKSKLKKQVKDTLEKEQVASAVEDVSMDEREVAKESGLSTPRYAVVKSIVGVEDLDEATIEVAKSKSTGELLAIAEDVDGTIEADDAKGKKEELKDDAIDVEVCEEIHEDEPEVVEEEGQTETKEDTKDDVEEEDAKEDASKDEDSEDKEDEEAITADEKQADAQDEVQEDEPEAQPAVVPQAASPSEVPVVENLQKLADESKVSEELEDLGSPLEMISDQLELPVEP